MLRVLSFVMLLCCAVSFCAYALHGSAQVVHDSGSSLTFWYGDTAHNIEQMKQGNFNPYREFNSWVNNLLFKYCGLEFLPKMVETYLTNNGYNHEISYYAICYVRDLIAGTGVYWIFGAIWHVIIYKILGHQIFISKGRSFPTTETIVGQMQVAQTSLLVYAGLPVLSEYLIESGWTRVYFYVDQVGWVSYAAYLMVYIALVEIGIYWMHRTLHTNKFLYNYVHAMHHKYKSAETLTPWASIAFNPLDGILQACPYVICLFFVPVHYFTHVALLFFSGVWATNIHDSVPADTEPIMGAKYHTVHHTHLIYNYGQFFTFCDYFWGTLRIPKDKPSNINLASSEDVQMKTKSK